MILEIEHGCFGYPKQKEILKDINLHLEKGHILSVLGPNGIGKTTLLKCMIGLLPWTSGRSLLNGEDTAKNEIKMFGIQFLIFRRSITFLFHIRGWRWLCLEEAHILDSFQQPGVREIEMAEAMMEKVGIKHLANKDCNRISGGELQMVLIARALINEPELIILDEPETGLDFHNQILVLNMIERLAHEEGISAIMNTHYPTNAMRIADEAFMMNRKGNHFYGTTDSLSVKAIFVGHLTLTL